MKVKTLSEDDVAALEVIQANIRAFTDEELAYELVRRGFNPADYRRLFAYNYAIGEIAAAREEGYGEGR